MRLPTPPKSMGSSMQTMNIKSSVMPSKFLPPSCQSAVDPPNQISNPAKTSEVSNLEPPQEVGYPNRDSWPENKVTSLAFVRHGQKQIEPNFIQIQRAIPLVSTKCTKNS